MRTHSIGGVWGNHISWLPKPQRRTLPRYKVYGHMSRPPEVNDLLEAPMESGRTGIFQFAEVQREKDPADMFFAVVKWVGYKEIDG